MTYYVYMLANRQRGTLYIGVTNDLIRRAYEHREGLVDGFANSRDVKTLVFFGPHDDIEHAIAYEQRLKRWRRDWKVQLIERDNPDWRDLYGDLLS